MARRSFRRAGDWHGFISSLGAKSQRRLSRGLDRAPVRIPVLVLAAGVAGVAAGWFVDDRLGASGLLAATLLYAAGGVAALIGCAGLVSAALVHIVRERDR